MAIGDHFYQIQHSALPARAIEEYLTWLFRDKAKVIGSNHHVELQAEFDREQIGRDLGDIKAIEIGGLVPETVRDGPTPPPSTGRSGGKTIEVEIHETIGDKFARTFQSARKILDDLLGEVEATKIIEFLAARSCLGSQGQHWISGSTSKFPEGVHEQSGDGFAGPTGRANSC